VAIAAGRSETAVEDASADATGGLEVGSIGFKGLGQMVGASGRGVPAFAVVGMLVTGGF